MTIKPYGATAGDQPLAPLDIMRGAPGAHDVQIEIAYCSVCHSGFIKSAASGKGPCILVPGHEIVGCVSAVGDGVEAFKVGDFIGVGWMVDSFQHCSSCNDDLEQYCEYGT